MGISDRKSSKKFLGLDDKLLAGTCQIYDWKLVNKSTKFHRVGGFCMYVGIAWAAWGLSPVVVQSVVSVATRQVIRLVYATQHHRTVPPNYSQSHRLLSTCKLTGHQDLI